MHAGILLFGKIAKTLNTKMQVRMWTDNEALVRRMKKLLEYNPISAYTKNDPDLYVGMREAVKELEVREAGHVKGHQDRMGRALSVVEKLNVLADKLTTRAVEEGQPTTPNGAKKWVQCSTKQGLRVCT